MTPSQIIQEIDARKSGAHANDVHLIRALAENQQRGSASGVTNTQLAVAASQIVTAMIENKLIINVADVYEQIEKAKAALS